jgi:hypothetical protein
VLGLAVKDADTRQGVTDSSECAEEEHILLGRLIGYADGAL